MAKPYEGYHKGKSISCAHQKRKTILHSFKHAISILFGHKNPQLSFYYLIFLGFRWYMIC